MLTVCTWYWGTKYDTRYVLKLASGLNRHLQQPHKKVLITDRTMATDTYDEIWSIPVEDFKLLAIKGCFARLRMFDPWWQRWNKLEDRLVCFDLDTIITGPLDDLFDRPEPFMILQGANASNPCPYVGAMMMLRSGAYPEVWESFSVEAAQKIQYYEFPDDQGWLWHVIPDAPGWKAGHNGVYAFMKPGWPNKDGSLPTDARIVTFPGHRDPGQFTHLDWVQRHWQ